MEYRGALPLGALVTTVLLAGFAPTASGQDVAAGKDRFATCAACHGATGEGNKSLNAPAIAGQERWYLIRQLQNFKKGVRGANPGDVGGTQMAPMAQTLATDADITDVATYIASLPAAAITHDGGGDPAAGMTMFATCAACHGPDGTGMEATNAPNLTLQQDWYVIRQLQNFKRGVRGSHAEDMFGSQMAPMAQTLTDDASVKNIAAYLASLRK